MDPEVTEVFNFVMNILPWVGLILTVSIGGWVLTTWLRIKNGYPLESSWGMPIHPKTDRETMERVRLLTNENAQLRAELGSIKDRLENVERIVTDKPSALSREIEALAIDKGGHA